MNKNTVCVLMSTYNGEKFIREQLDSILAQQGDFSLYLLIRDDGSSDTTCKILDEYAQQYSNVLWYTGENMGSCFSFLDLVHHASEYDYYAFADQDDYWLPDKIQVAIQQIHNDCPFLYTSAKAIVDVNLTDLHRPDAIPKYGILNALLRQNIASGCTMVFNKKLRDIIDSCKLTERTGTYHDSWVFKLATLYGQITYDPIPHILYRQHSNNCVGALLTGRALFLDKIKKFQLFKSRRDTVVTVYARCLLESARAELSFDDKKILTSVAFGNKSLRRRIRLFFTKGLSTKPFWEYLWIKIKILFGLF